MNEERVRELEERLLVMGRLTTSMLLEFVTKEVNEALGAINTMRHALLAKGVVSEKELARAAQQTFRHGKSDTLPRAPDPRRRSAPSTGSITGREPSVISVRP